MKTKLLFAKQRSNKLYITFVFLMLLNWSWSQTNLLLNSTMDEFTTTTNDNSDAWDMSPPSTVITDQDAIDGTTTPSPYRALWNNTDLDSWLDTNCGDNSEAPGSSSDGNFDYSAGAAAGVPTRGVKINEACRRLYQYVEVTAGVSYTLFVESRSEASGVPSEIYILNTEISDETDLTSTSTNVDEYFEITNDFNSSKSNSTTDNFTKTTLEFTPSGSFVVIYIKSPLAVDSSTEVFFDNIELYESSTLSSDDFSISTVTVYPNPTIDFIKIKSNFQDQNYLVEIYDLLGKKVIDSKVNNSIDVSNLTKGLYLLKIVTESNSIITKKIVKQ